MVMSEGQVGERKKGHGSRCASRLSSHASGDMVQCMGEVQEESEGRGGRHRVKACMAS